MGGDIDEARKFAYKLLQDVNDHSLALALLAIGLGKYDLACEWIQLEKAHQEAGELTPALSKVQIRLLDKLGKT
jgi:hypothetical protein